MPLLKNINNAFNHVHMCRDHRGGTGLSFLNCNHRKIRNARVYEALEKSCSSRTSTAGTLLLDDGKVFTNRIDTQRADLKRRERHFF